jgi:hypothetical protein
MSINVRTFFPDKRKLMNSLVLTLLSLVILCISVSSAVPSVEPVMAGDFCIKSEGGKYYLGDKNCKAITPAKYDTVYKLLYTLFVGNIQGKSCLISSGGKELTPAKYDYFSVISERFLKGAVNK